MVDQDLLTSWVNAVLLAVGGALTNFLAFFPNLLAALIVFTIGWVVAGLIKSIVLQILKVAQLEPFAEKVGLTQALKKVGATIGPNELIGELVKWGIVLVFLSPTVEILGLRQVTTVLNDILTYIPNVLVAVLIVMFGVIFADLTAQFVKGTAAALGSSTAAALSVITKYSIAVFAFLAALTQLGIAERLIATLFTGLVAMLAIAGGLAFGLGGKELAAELLQELKKSLQEKR